MSGCIICLNKNVTFDKPEHIIPKGLVRNNLVLRGAVCDLCNQRFGKTIDTELTTDKVIKARFRGDSPPIEIIEFKKDTKQEATEVIESIMRGEEQTAYHRGKENTTILLFSSEKSDAGTFGVGKSNLDLKYSEKYLFAITKIGVEYLYYVASQRNISVRRDPIFRSICFALYQYTARDKVHLTNATKAASKIWPVKTAGAHHSHIMPFKINAVWREMSVSKYLEFASNGNHENILYWLQVVNFQGCAGVIIALGKIPPVVAIVGSKSLAYNLSLIHKGQVLQENSRFR
jgi:hypothetical protein